MLPLTPSLLKSCMPRATMASCEAWAGPLNDAMDAYGMNTIERQAGLLGSVENETGAMHATKEVSYYGTDYDYCVNEVFGSRMPPRDVWESWRAQGREAFYKLSFDWLYDDRRVNLGLGNNQDGDGSKYVGRGVGITGRYLYKLCGDAIGADLISNPDLLLEPKWAALSIAFLWQRVKNNERLDRGDAFGAFKALNSGLQDYIINRDHMSFYHRIRGVLIQAHLQAAGFDPQGLDGILGPRSHAQIYAFQANRGLSTTSEPDAATLAALAMQGRQGQAA